MNRTRTASPMSKKCLTINRKKARSTMIVNGVQWNLKSQNLSIKTDKKLKDGKFRIA